MLAKDEFDLRVGQAFASRTYADLAALTTDLPAGLAVTQPRKPARVQGKARVLRTGAVLTASTALYAAMWPLALSIHRNMEGNPIPYDGKLILLSTLLYLFVLLFVGVRSSPTGRTSVPVGSHRGGQRLARVVRRPSACHRPPRTGSSRRAIRVTSTPPKLHRSVAPARCFPAGGHLFPCPVPGRGGDDGDGDRARGRAGRGRP